MAAPQGNLRFRLPRSWGISGPIKESQIGSDSPVCNRVTDAADTFKFLARAESDTARPLPQPCRGPRFPPGSIRPRPGAAVPGPEPVQTPGTELARRDAGARPSDPGGDSGDDDDDGKAATEDLAAASEDLAAWAARPRRRSGRTRSTLRIAGEAEGLVGGSVRVPAVLSAVPHPPASAAVQGLASPSLAARPAPACSARTRRRATD